MITIIAGCGGSGGSGGSTTGLKEITKMLPDDIYCVQYLNLSDLRSEKDLADIYDEYNDLLIEELGYFEFGEDYEQFSDDIDWVVSADYGDIYILGGNINSGEIERILSDNDYESEEYRNKDIWIHTEYDEAVAIIGGELFIGEEDYIKGCIEVLSGSSASVYDVSSDVKYIIDNTPYGIQIWAGGLQEIEPSAVSFKKIGNNKYQISSCDKLENEEAAEEYIEEIKSYVESGGLSDIKVKSSNGFVAISVNGSLTELDDLDLVYLVELD